MLFAYEYLITLDGEVTLFWVPRQVNGPFILFLLNRYLILTVQIMNWVPFPSSFHVCARSIIYVYHYSQLSQRYTQLLEIQNMPSYTTPAPFQHILLSIRSPPCNIFPGPVSDLFHIPRNRGLSKRLLRVAFSALRSYALCPQPYRLVVSAIVFALSSFPLIWNMVVRIFGVIRDTCFHREAHVFVRRTTYTSHPTSTTPSKAF